MILINQSSELLSKLDGQQGIALLKEVEHAGRNCYASYDKVTDDSAVHFVEALIRRGHETPLEFASLTFALVTSRAVLAELTRHRLASFCVESQRYIQQAKTGDIPFIKPTWYVEENGGDTVAERKSEMWRAAMLAAEHSYKTLIEMKATPQEAREVLPNSTACRIVVKANLREWRHIFALRCDTAAYPQMRELARIMLKQAHEMIPVVFDDLAEKYLNK